MVWSWDNVLNSLNQNIEIYIVMCRYRNDWCIFGNCSLDEFLDFIMRLNRSFFRHDIDFILNDYNVLNTCNL